MLFDDCWIVIFLLSDVASSAEFVFNASCPSRCTCETPRSMNCSGAILSDVSFENIPFQVRLSDIKYESYITRFENELAIYECNTYSRCL